MRDQSWIAKAAAGLEAQRRRVLTEREFLQVIERERQEWGAPSSYTPRQVLEKVREPAGVTEIQIKSSWRPSPEPFIPCWS